MPAPDAETPSLDLDHGLVYADEGKNYYEWQADSFAPHLRQAAAAPDARCRIVEHGSGTGALSRLLLQRGVSPLVLTEPDPKLAAQLKIAFDGRAEAQVVPGTLEEVLAHQGPGTA